MTTLELPGANPAAPSASSFMPDMSWTKNIPAAKRLDCISVASEVFTQAERKLSQVERTGLDRERVRVAAFLPRLPETPLDRGRPPLRQLHGQEIPRARHRLSHRRGP